MQNEAIRKSTKEAVKAAGDYAIFDLSHTTDGIMFCCPHDGCGDICHLPLEPLSKGWTWNETTKTLSPSIQRLDETRCKHHFSLILVASMLVSPCGINSMDDYVMPSHEIGCSISYDELPDALVPLQCEEFPEKFKQAMAGEQ